MISVLNLFLLFINIDLYSASRLEAEGGVLASWMALFGISQSTSDVMQSTDAHGNHIIVLFRSAARLKSRCFHQISLSFPKMCIRLISLQHLIVCSVSSPDYILFNH